MPNMCVYMTYIWHYIYMILCMLEAASASLLNSSMILT